MKRPTIYDIAKICDCSPATVSLALNGNSKVKDVTSKKILEVSRAIDYKPSYFGKSLVTGKANAIGMFVPDMQNQVFLSMISGVEEQLKGTGYHLLLEVTRNDIEKEKNSINNLLDNKVDGIIISPLYKKELTEYIVKNNVDLNRIVYLGTDCGSDIGIRFVETNSFSGAYKGVCHMIEKGRKRIAFFAPTVSKTQGIRRFEGYKKALFDNEIDFDEELVFSCDQDFKSIYSVAKDKLSKLRPDGIFSLYDMAAIPIIRAALDLNIHIPDDMSIVGYDNIEAGRYIEHSLTTLETYQHKQGSYAAQMLMDLIAGKKCDEKIVVEPTLIIRESS